MRKFSLLFMSVHHNITMPDAPESGDVCQNGNQNHAASQPPDIACKAGNHRSNGSNDNALRTLHETYLTLNIQTLSTGTDITYHHRTDHRCKGDYAHPEPGHSALHTYEDEADAKETYQSL